MTINITYSIDNIMNNDMKCLYTIAYIALCISFYMVVKYKAFKICDHCCL